MSDATLNPIQNVTRIGTEYYTYSDLRVTFHKAPSAYRTVNLRDLILYAWSQLSGYEQESIAYPELPQKLNALNFEARWDLWTWQCLDHYLPDDRDPDRDLSDRVNDLLLVLLQVMGQPDFPLRDDESWNPGICWHFGCFQRLRHLKLPDWHIFLSVGEGVQSFRVSEVSCRHLQIGRSRSTGDDWDEDDEGAGAAQVGGAEDRLDVAIRDCTFSRTLTVDGNSTITDTTAQEVVANHPLLMKHCWIQDLTLRGASTQATKLVRSHIRVLDAEVFRVQLTDKSTVHTLDVGYQVPYISPGLLGAVYAVHYENSFSGPSDTVVRQYRRSCPSIHDVAPDVRAFLLHYRFLLRSQLEGDAASVALAGPTAEVSAPQDPLAEKPKKKARKPKAVVEEKVVPSGDIDLDWLDS